jgi:hypothetical protein
MIVVKGAQFIGEALKINKATTSTTRHSPLLSARPLPRATAIKCARFVVRKGADGRDCFVLGPGTFGDIQIGPEGAQYIGEALKINKALIFLECASDPLATAAK